MESVKFVIMVQTLQTLADVSAAPSLRYGNMLTYGLASPAWASTCSTRT